MRSWLPASHPNPLLRNQACRLLLATPAVCRLPLRCVLHPVPLHPVHLTWHCTSCALPCAALYCRCTAGRGLCRTAIPPIYHCTPRPALCCTVLLPVPQGGECVVQRPQHHAQTADAAGHCGGALRGCHRVSASAVWTVLWCPQCADSSVLPPVCGLQCSGG
jgi:hypothetical protein